MTTGARVLGEREGDCFVNFQDPSTPLRCVPGGPPSLRLRADIPIACYEHPMARDPDDERPIPSVSVSLPEPTGEGDRLSVAEELTRRIPFPYLGTPDKTPAERPRGIHQLKRGHSPDRSATPPRVSYRVEDNVGGLTTEHGQYRWPAVEPIYVRRTVKLVWVTFAHKRLRYARAPVVKEQFFKYILTHFQTNVK